MNKPKSRTFLRPEIGWPLAVVLLTLLVTFVIFHCHFYEPNRHMFAFGGDALVIYFDVAYHVMHGHGTTFAGGNYPHGEYVFLTDMEGALSTVLQWVNRHVLEVGEYVVGIVNGFMLYLLPVASLMVFFLLRHFGVRHILAVAYSILLVFLAPQMQEFGGHYGLAFPFVIPMAILWAVRKMNVPRLEKRDVAVFLVLLFFTFNNPYIGFCSAGLLGCLAAVLGLSAFRQKRNLRPAALIGGLAFLVLFIPYLVFHFSDPATDRIEQQWGFFYYRATFEGVFCPSGSLAFQLLEGIGIKVKMFADPSRSKANIGLACTLVLATLLCTWAMAKLRKRQWGWVLPPELKYILPAALILFVYSANYSIIGFGKDWQEEHLGPLLMFKASGRFAWALYFVLTLMCVLFFENMRNRIKSPNMAHALLVVFILIWSFEIKEYVADKYTGHCHPNFFIDDNKKEIQDIFANGKVNPTAFQAILTVPKALAWNDNLISDYDWESHFYATRIAVETGLPMVNAMHSRMPLGQAAAIAQMYASPIVERELPAQFPNRKDLLIVTTKAHAPLTVGEQHLLDISTPLFEAKRYSLRRLSLADLERGVERAALRTKFPQQNTLPAGVIHLSFDDEKSRDTFFGAGAKTVGKGRTEIVNQPLPLGQDTQYVFSAWTKLDHKKYGLGEWKLKIMDGRGNAIFTKKIETRRGNDVQGGWLRSELQFAAPAGASIIAEFNGNRELAIDEVLIYPLGSEVFMDGAGGNFFLYNGFKIRK